MSAAPQPDDPARMDGQRVVIAGGAAERRLALARRFEQGGAQVEGVDARDPAQCRAAVERTVAAHGRLDVWVNAHSMEAVSGPAETLPSGAWEAALSGLLSAAFYGAQAAGAYLLAQGRGVIVNVASVEAYQSIEGRAVYSAASAGLVALTRSLAVEWAGRGVRVVGVAPGLAADAAHARRTPLRRLAAPDDLAEAVYYLASDEAAFIVGETLRVDGGWTAYHLF